MKRVRCGSDTEQRHAAREAGEMEDQRPDHRPVRGLGVRRQGRKAEGLAGEKGDHPWRGRKGG